MVMRVTGLERVRAAYAQAIEWARHRTCAPPSWMGVITMKLVKQGDGLVRRPPVPNAPTVTVIVGGEEGGPDVGLVRVHLPAGAGMPAHRHNGSDVILTPTTGTVRISKGADVVDVNVGDSALIRKDEEVSLTNPGSEDADVIVAAGPADFITGIRSWPAPDED